jgi:outer membrane protein TolC
LNRDFFSWTTVVQNARDFLDRTALRIPDDVAGHGSLEAKVLLRVAQQTVDARQLVVDTVQALASAKLKSELDLSFAKVDQAQARYNLGLGSIVEFSQAELQKKEADIDNTDAKYQYRLTQIALAYVTGSPF